MLTVRQCQSNLKHYYGYYTGAVDGKPGAKTKAAVRAFQAAHGLKADGIYGEKTNAKLVAVVKSLQAKLGVAQDGIVGARTVAAIKAVQKLYGLVQDGIAGAKTFAKLNGTPDPSGGWDGSAHFKKSEMKCKCGGKYCNGYPAGIDAKLMEILEGLRSHYGKPVVIKSGLRCSRHNAAAGGVSNSKHKTGKAADIYIPGICDTASGRNGVKAKAYALGAAYSYCNTEGMGKSVHVNT